MKQWIKWLLNFLRITDESGVLSITNMLVYTFAVKYAMTPVEAAAVGDMAMALSAMGVYLGKKVITGVTQAKTPDIASDVINKIKDMAE